MKNNFAMANVKLNNSAFFTCAQEKKNNFAKVDAKCVQSKGIPLYFKEIIIK